MVVDRLEDGKYVLVHGKVFVNDYAEEFNMIR